MEDFKNLQETQLSSQPIFDGDVLHIFKDTIRLPNGKQATREYTVHHGAVCILPLLENGDVLLEHQFRYPMGEVITEIPAGKLEPGEDPFAAAQRELKNWGVLFTDGGRKKLITAEEARALRAAGKLPSPGAVLTPLAKEIMEGKK